MPGQEGLKSLKGRLANKFNRFLHSLAPGRSRLSLDHQATVGFEPTSIHGITDIQPLNSPSLPNTSIYPSMVIDSAGVESPGRVADLASAGFQGVKTTLQLVERAADGFPPLKSTVGALLGVIDIVEVCELRIVIVVVFNRPQTAAQNQHDCRDLEQKLRAVVSVINNHANYSRAPTFTTRLEGLSA